MVTNNLKNMSREQKNILSRGFWLFAFVLALFGLFALKYDKPREAYKDDVDSSYTSDISWSYVADKTPRVDSSVFVKMIFVPIDKGCSVSEKDCFADSATCAKAVGDSAVSLPIVQRVYSDSAYIAYVSGYEPHLDSISIKYRTITNTITRTIKSTKKWNVGIVGGYGYGLLSNRMEPFVGIGFSYNIFDK